ncbi:MAG: energy-coupling factor transporter transmembrane protein EcfT [Lachnospiraceae bacterium]|nr:energy-coupling factor transporter transmembrane protein EcfT [Lachnospiraceae bacterium]
MFKDITIGQYYPGNSIIHKLDPRVKLLGVVVYIAALFIINNIWGFIFLTAAMVVLISLSQVPLSHILKGLKFVWFLVALALFFNLFFSDGNIIWSWWIFHMSTEGIFRAIFFALRLIFVIVGASMLTYTTTPTTLTNGLEKVFKPLDKIHFPGHEIAMMMSIALRFIPILTEEINKIIKAQLARGADFDTGGVIAKAKGMIPILVPLFVSAFRRATDLATAMESRCYHGGNDRTKMFPLKYEKRDKIAYFILLFYLLASIAITILMNMFLTWGTV